MVTIANADIGHGEAIRMSQNRSDEFCTHFVNCYGETIWGHYFGDYEGAYEDYRRRVNAATERIGAAIPIRSQEEQ